MPTLAEKRKKWLEALSGEDRHSIIHQLTQMTWDAAAFRVVNEARRLAPRDPDGGVKLNGLMHSLLTRAFFVSHMAAVRRLRDDRWTLEGKRGVYSISALLKDMLEHQELLTREAIFAAEGLEYDYEPVRQRFEEYSRKQREAGKQAFSVPSELWWHKHEYRHEQFDCLAGVAPQDRRPRDMVRESVFRNLKEKVGGATEEVVTHVNKYIAHSAAPESRSLVNADEAGLTLSHLWDAHQHLCEVAGFLAICVLGDSCPSFLPGPQYDQFRHIERPLIESSQVGLLGDLWDKFDRESDAWSQWGLDQYEKEFGSAG